ncbi:MAG: hypothetical protein EBX40_04115, partial [Gammaproteobacteria bacterium]|nr:hypothetical protein [Gammaproteobacteria bacterium]
PVVPRSVMGSLKKINYSKHSNFLEYVQSWLFTFDTPIEKAESLIRKAANSVVRSFYGKIEEYSLREIDRRNHVLSELLDFDVHVKIIVQTEKPTGFKVKLTYYAYPKDHDNIDQAILKAILRALSTHPDIHLLEAV